MSGSGARRWWWGPGRYAFAVIAVGLAVLARWAMMPVLGTSQLPFSFIFGAVILTAWLCRIGPAIVATFLGLAVGNYLFFQPGNVMPPVGEATTRALAFILSSLFAASAIEAIHRANARAQKELAERRRSEAALKASAERQETLYRFVDRIQHSKTLSALYEAAIDAILRALGCDRASILLLDEGKVMRFVGSRGLSPGYRAAVEGHSPWKHDERDPAPIHIDDVAAAEMEESLRATVRGEGIGSLAFIPLVVDTHLIGKFMAYHDEPHGWSRDELDLALAIGRQLAFAIARKRDEKMLEASEQRLEQALAAGRMGAWEWHIPSGRVIWSPTLEAMHGLAPGEFGGTFQDVRREMHPEDVSAVEARIAAAIDRGTGYHAAYRIRRRDGEERWVEAFARIARGPDGRPERLSGVCMDITERRRAEMETERLLDREHQLRQSAEEANRVKDEFLATLSHELRNPLNAILGYSELLLRRCETEGLEDLRPIGEALKRNSLIQSTLIRDLLDLSRLRSGKVDLTLAPFDALEAAGNAVQTVRAEAAAKDVSIEIVTGVERLIACGDALRFEQVAWNLLNNAVKFTPPGGRITIRLGVEGPDAVMVVEDTGQGIDPQFLPHIFEMFRQADSSTRRTHSGMGIGLALVRQLVELQGGSVTAASAGKGRGARFTVRLPVESGSEARAGVSRAEGSPPRLEGKRILVVDDSADTVEMLRLFLESCGAIPKVAHGAAEALVIARGGSWDAVLSDVSMPEMDGFELLARLRELPQTRDVPVLALTGYGQAKDVERVRAAGFQAHMTKPIDLDVLARLLSGLWVSADEPERTITKLPTAAPS